MGDTLLAGRDFTWEDAYDKRPVGMVSENLARELWKEPSAAIGKRIRESRTLPWREIVGVVGDDAGRRDGQEATAAVYWPIIMRQFSRRRTRSAFAEA